MWRGLEGSSNGSSIAGGLASSQMERLQAAPGIKGGGDSANGVLEEAETFLELGGVEGGNAHHHVAVAIDVLCDAVDDDVGAKVERVLDEGVVDNDKDAVAVGHRDDGTDIDETQRRVAGGLDPDQAGLLIDVLTDVDLDLGCECDPNTVGLCNLGEVTVGAAIYIRY
ncbi:unnamed protein product [Clonostachys rosea f. rosea IK726]|uniref:Uncharacterized protein n=1 Tax=Clonostachys rosea f. rosea IK726 TaxID=1349383 RepID=A0ACA9TF98_BIOOC|nr:unnamed protein product [Clonostachys rosea f. rosea IK726]